MTSSRTRGSSAASDELDGIRALLDRGNSAEQQLRVFNANRDIAEVVRGIADATEELPAAVGGDAVAS